MDACLNFQDCFDARQDKILSPVSRQVLDKAVVVKVEESDSGTWYCKVQVTPSVFHYLGSETSHIFPPCFCNSFEFSPFLFFLSGVFSSA